ncbi:MAG TPA: prenyltransferase [Actinomycetota bacterium]|nr:prenyltransferase [Actinomycetota bacterium]
MTVVESSRRSVVSTWAEVLRTCGTAGDAPLDPIGKWLVVTRACVQPMTLTAAAIAGALAVESPGFDTWLFALAVVGIVLAHAANNMINDYFDLSEGQDTATYPRSLYAPHPVNSGLVTKRELGRAILVTNVADAVIMLVLFTARGWPVIAFALAGLVISVFYVAPPLRFKAHGLGEPSVFVIWGPLMVGGTYYSATGTLPLEVIWASVPYALLVTTVLFGKHIDKAPWDAPSGTKTLPVILGEGAARKTTVVLMVAFYVVVVALVVAGVLSPFALLALAAFLSLRRAVATYSRPRPSEPPPRYPLWPLWFGPWAFLHARRAGLLFVAGLILGVVWRSNAGA